MDSILIFFIRPQRNKCKEDFTGQAGFTGLIGFFELGIFREKIANSIRLAAEPYPDILSCLLAMFILAEGETNFLLIRVYLPAFAVSLSTVPLADDSFQKEKDR